MHRRSHRATLMTSTLTVALLSACASAPEPAPEPAAPVLKGSVEVFEGDARIGRYTSSPWGFSTVSYWIEGPEGVVVIDTQFLLSAAEELIEAAEAHTGKKVVAAIVLHANPDKFNGTPAFQARGIKVLTSAQIIALMPEVHDKRVKAFYERYKPDYPLELPRPDSFGDQTTTLQLAGLPVELHVTGAGCSEAHVIATFDGHLFGGDLLANGTHSWLEIGRTDAWLQRLDEMDALAPRFVHPGRGASGGPDLIAQERTYLLKIIELVAAATPTLPPDKEALARVQRQIEALYPKHRYAVFLNIGLPAEWRRQASARPSE